MKKNFIYLFIFDLIIFNSICCYEDTFRQLRRQHLINYENWNRLLILRDEASYYKQLDLIYSENEERSLILREESKLLSKIRNAIFANYRESLSDSDKIVYDENCQRNRIFSNAALCFKFLLNQYLLERPFVLEKEENRCRHTIIAFFYILNFCFIKSMKKIRAIDSLKKEEQFCRNEIISTQENLFKSLNSELINLFNNKRKLLSNINEFIQRFNFIRFK